MTGRAEAMAEAYRRNLMNPEQKAAYEEAMRRGLVPGLDRSVGQRLLDNLEDGILRGPVQAFVRADNPSGAPRTGFSWTMRSERGVATRIASAILGRDDQLSTVAADRERERRTRYEARAEADPISNAGDVGAYFAGQLAGAALDPSSWVGGGGSYAGRQGLKQVATVAGRNAVTQGAANAAADVVAQGTDVFSGVQDDYSLGQTGLAFGFGAALSGVSDGVRPVSRMVRRAFTDPVPPPAPATPAVHPGAVGGQIAGAPTATSSAALTAAATPPVVTVPEFSIVQRVARRTPILDGFARMREGEIPQMVGDVMGRAYTAVVSDLHPLIRATEGLRRETEQLTGHPVDLLPSQDPRMLSRGRYDWAAIGHQDLLHGVHAYQGLTPTTPALADVISAVAVRAKRMGQNPIDAVQRFNEYMVARRSSLEWDRRARGELDADPVSKTKAEADAFVTHIEKTDPEFRELSDSVNAFAGGLLKKAHDGGLINAATYKASLAGRDFYVPLRRVMDDSVRTGGKGTSRNAGPEVKRFKGSERDVVDPVSVLIERTYKLNQRLRQNELNLSFVRLAEKLEAAQRASGVAEPANSWIRKVETKNRPVRVSKAEMAAQSNRPGDIDKMFGDDIEVWRPGEINDAGKAILNVWRNGKREAWEIIDEAWGKDVFESLTGMSKGMQDTFLNAVAAPTAVLAQTITRDPAFLFSNFIRDQVSAWIITDVGFKPGEGALGIVDELKQGDLSRLYARSSGISGGAATAMLGDTLHRTDTMALAQRGIKAKYFSSLGGLLNLSEISETGTRVRVFKRAFERAKKAGFTEYDSLIQGSFTARDMIDFGRAGSKMHYTRRLVTFLNASVQGMDKTLRVLGADGAMTRVSLKDAIAPLFNRAPGAMVRAEDRAALTLATKAWTKVSAIATIGLTLSAMFSDDPEYQQANERTRATHWTIPWGDTLVKVPKPFELAFLSNIVERSYEASIGQDEKAMGRMWRGLGELFEPPTDIPVASVVGGLQSNTNAMTGRPIIPDHLQELPPELQYQHWNSQFSRWLGGVLNVSPAQVDYAIQGFGGPFGSYLLNGMDAADPDRPSGSWTDLPVVRRFVQPWQRGAQDQRDFYDRAGARTSELMRAKNGIDAYIERGNPAAAKAIMDELDESGRAFVLSQMGAAPTRRLSPLDRARVFAQESSALIGELNGALPKDDGAPLPPMSRSTRQMIEEAVERITVAEMRNAMIVTRQPGFQNREMMDRDGYWEDLRDLAPEVAAELERRLGSGRNRAYDYAAVMEAWPQVEERLRAEGSMAYLDDLAADVMGRTASWGEKVESEESEPVVFEF